MQTTDPENSLAEEAALPADQAAKPRASSDTTALGNFEPGDIVGGSYEVLAVLGRGGMGAVYRAKHVSMPAEYALKVLIRDRPTEHSVIRFQNEAQAIAKLNHPNIIAIYNFGLHEGRLPFYVMDLLSGDNLLESIDSNGPAPIKLALPIFIEVCAGLGHAHRKGILHRDVKPANIVILREPDVRGARVKVVDFGIVKFSEELMPEAQKLTAMGAVVGSPSYMSPEQSTGEKIDPRSDIYSLGCSLFQTLTGRVPFHGRNPTETMLMHQEKAAPSLASKGEGLVYPEDLELLVAKMIAKEPMDRYQSMDAVAQDLKNVLEDKPLGTPAVVLPRPGEGAANLDPRIASAVGPQRSARVTTYDLHLLQSPAQTRPLEVGEAEASIAAPADCQTEAAEAADSGDIAGESTGETTLGGEVTYSGRAAVRSAATMVSIVMLSVCLIAGLCYLGWQAMQPAKQKASGGQMSTNLSAEGDQAGSKAFVPAAPQLADPRGPALIDDTATVQLTRAQYFSKTIVVNGRQMLQFDFPNQSQGEALAWIATTAGDSRRTQGRVVLAKGPPIYLLPLAGCLDVPQFFQKFRPGEISGVVLTQMTGSDQMFEYATAVPGISQLMIASCPQLTAKIVHALSKLHLTLFNVAGSNIDSEQLARAHFWQSLRSLSLSNCKNLTPILKKLSGSTNITTLDISDTKLSAGDYQLIAKLPNLAEINLTSNRLTVADLRSLSRLQKLTAICAVYTRLNGGSIIEELQHFPALKTIIILRGSMTPSELQRLKQACPNVMVKSSPPKSYSAMLKV